MHALTLNVRDLLLYHPNYVDKLDELFSIISAAINDRRVDVVYSGLPMIEIVPAGSGKGTCLAWLSDHLQVKKEAVVAFGDGMNDLQMLSWAGTGLAMGQSSQKVKSVADHVIGPVDQEGIAENGSKLNLEGSLKNLRQNLRKLPMLSISSYIGIQD